MPLTPPGFDTSGDDNWFAQNAPYEPGDLSGSPSGYNGPPQVGTWIAGQPGSPTFEDFQSRRVTGYEDPGVGTPSNPSPSAPTNTNNPPPNAPANTVDAMIARDRASWEQRLRAEAAKRNITYDPSDLEGVIRNVSYARNTGQDPQKAIDLVLAQYDRRKAPTFSAGGRGGDADLDYNAVLDPGWVRTPGGQYVRSTARPTPNPGPQSVGTFGNPTGFTGTGGGDWYTTGPTTTTAPVTLGSAYQYQPFTEKFVSPTAPSDLIEPWGRTFVAPQAPADLMDQWGRTYVRPTAADLLSDPGYLARLDAQQRAMERSAAAKGTLLTGGHQRSLAEYGQELASNEYQRLADRALNEYLSAFNVFTTDKARRAGEFGQTFGRALSGYQTDVNVDQADKARRSGEFGNIYGRSLGEFGQRRDIHDTNQFNAFQIGRAGRLDDQGILESNRRFGFDVDKDLWGRNRTGYLDDYMIYDTEDRKFFDRQFRLADYGRPLP